MTTSTLIKIEGERELVIFSTNIGLYFALDPNWYNGASNLHRFVLVSPCCHQLFNVNMTKGHKLQCVSCLDATVFEHDVCPIYRTTSEAEDASNAMNDWGVVTSSYNKFTRVQVLENWVAPFTDSFTQILVAREIEEYLTQLCLELRDFKTTEEAFSWLKAKA